MFSINSKKNKGFTLVETLVAISVLLTTLVGPITIASRSLNASFFLREQMVSVYLAQEGIESVLLLRDESALAAEDGILGDDDAWQWFINLDSSCKGMTGTTNGCGIDENLDIVDCGISGANCILKINDLSGSEDSFYTHLGSGGSTQFTRKIFLNETISEEEAQVVIEVSWYSPFLGQQHSTYISAIVSNQYSRYE